MTSDGAQTKTHVYSDIQLKFIGFLLAAALGLLGWGFNNWSKAVETGMSDVMQTIRAMDQRAERRDAAIQDLTRELVIVRERQQIMREQLQKHDQGHP